MKNLLLLIILIFAGCASHLDDPETETMEPAEELVDIRIDGNGQIILNGDTVSESSLPGAISALNIDENTRARFIIHDNAYYILVTKTSHLLHKRGVINFTTKMLGPDEFEEYDQNIVHIDVLSTGKILFQGQELHPDDLGTALSAPEYSSRDQIVSLSVNPDARYGLVTDIQEVLREQNILRIEYKTM